MRVDAKILRAVCFLCNKAVIDGVERYVYRGTGFFVAHQDFGGDKEVAYSYFVTAKHVVERARGYGDLYVRINVKDGVRYVALDSTKWIESDTADVAMQHILFTDSRITLLPRRMFVAGPHKMWLEENDIGVGDDLLLCGLFTQHVGRDQNQPIVRSGIISAMPAEPVAVKGGPSYPGYLVEVRSVGGLSGSPVFVVLDYKRPEWVKFKQPTMYLLGIVRGHWDYAPELDPTADADTVREAKGINTGIAVVTPIEELYKLLTRADLMAARRQTERTLRDEEGASLDAGPDDDYASEPVPPKRGAEPERLSIDGDFDAASRKLVQTPRPPGGFPKPPARKRKKG